MYKAHVALRSFAPLVALSVIGCGEPPPLDAQAQALATASVEVASGLECAATTSSFLTDVDLSRGASREALDIAARVIGTAFFGCAKATALAAPAVGLTVDFGSGCGIPLTPVRFEGAFTLAFVTGGGGGGGGSTLDLKFAALRLLDVRLDGELALASAPGAFSYVASGLRVGAASEEVTIDGRGTIASLRLHTAVRFDGDGMVTWKDQAFSFEAEGIERALGACYPERGRLTLTAAPSVGPPATVTITFDGGDSSSEGRVRLAWAGTERDWELPPRACRSR